MTKLITAVRTMPADIRKDFADTFRDIAAFVAITFFIAGAPFMFAAAAKAFH